MHFLLVAIQLLLSLRSLGACPVGRCRICRATANCLWPVSKPSKPWSTKEQNEMRKLYKHTRTAELLYKAQSLPKCCPSHPSFCSPCLKTTMQHHIDLSATVTDHHCGLFISIRRAFVCAKQQKYVASAVISPSSIITSFWGTFILSTVQH